MKQISEIILMLPKFWGNNNYALSELTETKLEQSAHPCGTATAYIIGSRPWGVVTCWVSTYPVLQCKTLVCQKYIICTCVALVAHTIIHEESKES